jgi:hypothetical protein
LQNEPDQDYDIYLSRCIDRSSDLAGLVAEVLALQQLTLQQRLWHPGVLQVALPREGAIEMLERLQEGARGSVLPAVYRQPRVSIEQTAPLSERTIKDLQAKRRPDDTLGPFTLCERDLPAGCLALFQNNV